MPLAGMSCADSLLRTACPAMTAVWTGGVSVAQPGDGTGDEFRYMAGETPVLVAVRLSPRRPGRPAGAPPPRWTAPSPVRAPPTPSRSSSPATPDPSPVSPHEALLATTTRARAPGARAELAQAALDGGSRGACQRARVARAAAEDPHLLWWEQQVRRCPECGGAVEAALGHVADMARFPGGELMIDLDPRLLAEHVAPGLAAALSRLLGDDRQPATRHPRSG